MSLRVLGRDTAADEDSLLRQDDRDSVINRCHDLRRNNPVAAGVAIGLADNVVGSQFRMQARTSDAGWNAAAEAWFRNWSANCDRAGRDNLTEILRHCVSARLFDGELFLVPSSDGTVAVVESERVRPPANGEKSFRLDIRGRVSAWYVADRNDKGEFDSAPGGRWVRDLIHAPFRWRPDQVRGWPQLATVATILADIGEINDANLKKYKMGALAAWVLTGGGQLRGRAGAGPAHSLQRFKDGQIYELEPGQSLSPFNNSQPGGEYAPFIDVNLKLIGAALRLPYEFLLQYFGGGTFASSKASLEQVHITVGAWQEWLETHVIRPLVSWRIAKAIADGELSPAPVDREGRSEWDRWQWQKPAVTWLDPQGAINTEMQEVRMGVRPLSDVAASRGYDLEEVYRMRAREIAMQQAVAAEFGINPAALSDIQIPGQAPISAGKETGTETEEKDEKIFP